MRLFSRTISKKIFALFFVAIIFIFVFLPFLPSVAEAKLVACDGPDCNLCKAFQTIHNTLNFLFTDIILPLTAVVFLIGGILLLSAGGSETNITRGKAILWNTFIGFLIAFGAWLVINTIIVNITPGIGGIKYDGVSFKWYQFPGCPGGPPDAPFVDINPPPIGDVCGAECSTCSGIFCNEEECLGLGPCIFTPGSIAGGTCAADPAVCSGGGGGNGTCEQVPIGPCSAESLSSTCFDGNAQNASIICNKESAGIPTRPSDTDKCKDGNSFTYGLFQIHMISNVGALGGACTGLFTVNGNAYPAGDCLLCKNGIKPPPGQKCPGSGNYCVKNDCVANSIGQYNSCLEIVRSKNIEIACQLSNNGANFTNDWFTSAHKCDIP